MSRRVRLHSGSRAVGLVAAIALGLAGATSSSPVPLILAGLATFALTVPRHAGRTPGAWAAAYLAFALRRRDHDGVLPAVCPGAIVVERVLAGTAVGTFSDGYGWAAALEIGASGGRLIGGGVAVPDASQLTSHLDTAPAADETDVPRTRVQMLTLLAHPYQRVFVTVRVGDDGIAWSDADLCAALTGAVSRLRRRLAGLGVAAHPLDVAGLRRAISWCAGGHPDAIGVHEAWDHLRIAGRWQTTIEARTDAGMTFDGLLARLASVLGTSVAVAQVDSGLTIRLTADTPAALARAAVRVAQAIGGSIAHLDGEQLAALRATLPICRAMATRPSTRGGGSARSVAPTRHGAATRSPSPAAPGGTATRSSSPGAPVGAATWSLPPAGLFLGRDRQGEAIHARMDPERAPLRITVVGGPIAGQVLADRARALTTPPVIVPIGSARPTARPGPPATRPGGSPVPVALAVLAAPTAADGAVLTGADIVVCQPMSPADAVVVAAALHLAGAGEWLSRIEGDMVAVISDHTVRWLRLATTVDERRRLPVLAGLARA